MRWWSHLVLHQSGSNNPRLLTLNELIEPRICFGSFLLWLCSMDGVQSLGGLWTWMKTGMTSKIGYLNGSVLHHGPKSVDRYRTSRDELSWIKWTFWVKRRWISHWWRSWFLARCRSSWGSPCQFFWVDGALSLQVSLTPSLISPCPLVSITLSLLLLSDARHAFLFGTGDPSPQWMPG